PEAQTRIYVDTGPVDEKAWAVKAGLGWQGKNTNVLNRRLGSWFFLGEIITDLELEPDAPGRDYCGSCTRCIDACPTRALEPYLLDGRRCVSYLTIELRGDIPEELREGCGPWIFGCDICQEVCPWNRKSPFSSEPEFERRLDVAETRLVPLSRMTPEEFSQRYRQTAIKRSKWRGLMRNTAVALGNSGNPEVAPELGRLLDDPDPMIRRHAAWALARIGSEEALRLLEQRRTVETDVATLQTLERLVQPDRDRKI
ncbi:MAG: tRNA epoxyqueuosine(34) reductase QueG, partial [Acidobacteria bacterium]